LSTARLDPLKRVDRIVEAFKRMPDKKLVVVSGGSEEEKIRKAAAGADNIKVLGWVSESKLQELMGNCIATIYIPMDEDFGISPVESMAAGKPVIGVQEGGVLETIGGEDLLCRMPIGKEKTKNTESFIETPHGLLIKKAPEIEDIVQAIYWMTPHRALEMRENCEARAQLFDILLFIRAMVGEINTL